MTELRFVAIVIVIALMTDDAPASDDIQLSIIENAYIGEIDGLHPSEILCRAENGHTPLIRLQKHRKLGRTL